VTNACDGKYCNMTEGELTQQHDCALCWYCGVFWPRVGSGTL